MNIVFDNVSKRYGGHTALNNISFTLYPGKIYGFLGSNGSGKSTTLKLMAGLMFPTTGSVKAGEQPVTRDMIKQTAYLTELDMFYPGFTVKDMLDFYESQFPDFQMEKAYQLLEEMQLKPEKR